MWQADYRDVAEPFTFTQDDVTLQLGFEWLAGCAMVEDWGCGTAYGRQYAAAGYRGIDVAPSRWADKVCDLREYRSDDADGIFMRHVLEHNDDWAAILENAVASFRRRFVLVVFTPFGDRTAKTSSEHDHGLPVMDYSFRKTDITDLFGDLPWTEQRVGTRSKYDAEHLFYVERPA